MGLLDVLTGMRNGPRGGGQGGGGMSPITMALLGLLAYKAVKGFGGSQKAPEAGARQGQKAGDPLSDLLKNIGLGGASSTGGSAAAGGGVGGLGGLISGGLGDLLKQFQTAGKGDVADS